MSFNLHFQGEYLIHTDDDETESEKTQIGGGGGGAVEVKDLRQPK